MINPSSFEFAYFSSFTSTTLFTNNRMRPELKFGILAAFYLIYVLV